MTSLQSLLPRETLCSAWGNVHIGARRGKQSDLPLSQTRRRLSSNLEGDDETIERTNRFKEGAPILGYGIRGQVSFSMHCKSVTTLRNVGQKAD